jgi:hypothetical protein
MSDVEISTHHPLSYFAPSRYVLQPASSVHSHFFQMKTFAINLPSEGHKANILYVIGHAGWKAFISFDFRRKDFVSGIDRKCVLRA